MHVRGVWAHLSVHDGYCLAHVLERLARPLDEDEDRLHAGALACRGRQAAGTQH